MSLDFNRVYKIYFSPTKTTKHVLDSIAEGTCIKEIIEYDFTTPKFRESFPILEETDLVLFGMPTYAGRLPNLILPYFDKVKGNNATVVPIVTFGNRALENSLYELKELLRNRNFRFLASAAFSCEHSFSYTLGAGRPDFDDLKEAYEFGAKILSLDIKDDLNVPGNLDGYFKPKEDNGKPINILKVIPKTNEKCMNCTACIKACPMGSINPNDPSDIIGKCIKCNACVKICKYHAKYFDDPGYLYHKKQLEEKYIDRKENSFFF